MPDALLVLLSTNVSALIHGIRNLPLRLQQPGYVAFGVYEIEKRSPLHELIHLHSVDTNVASNRHR